MFYRLFVWLRALGMAELAKSVFIHGISWNYLLVLPKCYTSGSSRYLVLCILFHIIFSNSCTFHLRGTHKYFSLATFYLYSLYIPNIELQISEHIVNILLKSAAIATMGGMSKIKGMLNYVTANCFGLFTKPFPHFAWQFILYLRS